MLKRLVLIVPLLLSLAFAGAFAQEGTTVATAEDPELGTYLTDAEGMTLYLFTNDTPGVSNCEGDCLANWPAFTAEEPLTLPEGVPGELTMIERSDGSMQVAYNGWPLYYWVNDAAPGDTTGHEVGDVWFVVNPAASAAEMTIPGMAMAMASPMASPAPMADTTVVTAESPELGTYLTDAEGMTLYLFTNDEPGVSNCEGDCLANWPAFTAEEPLSLPEGVPGELSQIERSDGSMQVAYNGWPLYYWVNDAAPGDTTGHGVGDVWYVVNPAASAEEMVIPGT
jgi:predicted lipoprotein with Yx(FWY)xxD motif